jgi:hypothetical protein
LWFEPLARTKRQVPKWPSGVELSPMLFWYDTPPDERTLSVPTPYPTEQMHRIKYTKLTPEQILTRLSASNGPVSASPLSDVLAGKSLRIVLDGAPALSYRFTGNDRLSVAEGDAAAVQA